MEEEASQQLYETTTESTESTESSGTSTVPRKRKTPGRRKKVGVKKKNRGTYETSNEALVWFGEHLFVV